MALTSMACGRRQFAALLVVFVQLMTGDSFLVPDGLQSVQTRLGEIRGHLRNVDFDDRVYQVREFLGIPYVKAPVGNLRFRKPELLTALPQSPFNAHQHGPRCPQAIPRFNSDAIMSEDCLFLNIYTPVTEDGSPPSSKPVMVWIHGGGFFLGSANGYDGSILSAYGDVVVVAINYRLGPLGFFSTHDPNAPGNFGLWDQQMAIQWVQSNIAAFGGDPDNITIFGESAGSSSVVYQMLYPGNKGIVKRAIAESGTTNAWGRDYNGMNLRESMNFAGLLGCGGGDTTDMMTCLRSRSEEEARRACIEFDKAYPLYEGRWPWVPVYDNEFVKVRVDTVLHDLSSGSISSDVADVFRGIDLIIGAANMDGSVYFPAWVNIMNQSSPLKDIYEFTKEQLVDIAFPEIAENSLNEKPTPLALQAVAFEYTNWNDPNNNTERVQSLLDISTDFALNAPSVLAAKGHQLGTKATYLYQFATAVPGGSPAIPPMLRSETSAAHGDELRFVFGFPNITASYPNFTRTFPTEVMVAKALVTMWTNFAKTG